MTRFCAAIFAALLTLVPVMPAMAQDVTLRSRDGKIEITGTLLGFDGEFYRVQSQFGELTVDGSGVSCDGVGCPSLVDYVAELRLSGSSTIGAVLMPALLESFALKNGLVAERVPQDDTHFSYVLKDKADKPVARFHFRATNTDEGFADLLADEADIAMALREIRPEEVALAREAGLGEMTRPNRSRVLALDAMVPVVSPLNPVGALSLSDLSRILSGRTIEWGDLGGADAPIAVHLRERGSGLSQGLEDRLLRPQSAGLRDDVTRHESNEALSNAVARDPFGLGFASFSEIGNGKPLTLTGPCGFELRATRRSIKTEDYPLTAPMFLYIPARRLPALARDFLRFTRTTPAQIVIRRAGFVDQAPEEIPIDLQGNRFVHAITVAEGADGLSELQRMAATLSGLDRLTTSFRFEAGSSRLDAQSRSNVQQLARALEEGVYDGRALLFVGFSDGVGPAAGNLKIAQKRAENVRQAVSDAAETADLARVTLSTDAFGEAMPMACDDSAWGRQVNRRVEIWVR